ncbi:MAG: hypothetical protein FRX49_10369 [Trebouxia sp. A1-2]|nr:MAG: hypothetical protein FRX49_10369 [Trebouxia sp. A1-2]
MVPGQGRDAPVESIYHLVHQGSKLSIGSRTQPIPVSSRPVRPFVPGHLSSHQNSSQLQSIFNPVLGYRDSQRRQGLTPTDHARLNRQAIKQMSLRNKETKQSNQQQEAHKIRAISRPIVKTPNIIDSTEKQAASAAVRRKREEEARQQRERWLTKEEYGKVPRYLQNIKVGLARQHAEKQAAKEAALVPPGMRIMPEEERLEMLGILDESRQDIEAKLQALPFLIETPSQKAHKTSLERRLQEIEEANKVFSRTKVLVEI